MKKWMKRLSTLGLITLAVIVLEFAIPIAKTPINRILGHLGVKTEFTGAFVGTAEASVADYTFDGTADDVQAQQMLDALPSTGGKLIFRGGNYNFTATVSRAINNVVVSGSGKATYFANNNSTALFSAGSQTGWMFEDLRTDVGWLTLSSTGDTVLLNVWNNTSYVDKTTAGGSTLPATPITNQIFLHTPTGRKILYQYDGSNWQAIQAYGTTTIYVDSTGTDSLNYGTGTGINAFATLNYAFNMLPLRGDDEATIYVASGNYTENHLWAGKDYTVYLIGTITATHLTATGGTKGSGATATQVTGNFTVGQYDNKIVKFTSGNNTDLRRVVGQTTNTTLYMVGFALPANPLNGDTYDVEDWATTFSGYTDIYSNGAGYVGVNAAGRGSIIFQHIKFYTGSVVGSGSATLYTQEGTHVIGQWCYVESNGNQFSVSATGYAHTILNSSVVKFSAAGGYAVYAEWEGVIDLDGARIIGSSNATDTGILASYMGLVNLNACEITTFQLGIDSAQNSVVGFFVSTVNSFIHNCGYYGIGTEKHSFIGGAAQITYGVKLDGTSDPNGGNSTNDAASYSWIAN